MSRLSSLTRLAALTGLVAAASCSTDKDILGPVTPSGGDIFRSYVALGNSLTAGWQSGGINDDTQRQSYARLLAISMGTQYHYASFNLPGCPAPVTNFLTQARLGAPNNPPCALRSSTSVTDVLNNVAVPDARSLDPISRTTVASNALTTFILGGKTQVERALDARPTFVSIWIGSNDVLTAGYTGLLTPSTVIAGADTVRSPGIVSTETVFEANYNAMLKQMLDSMPNLKGVLVGVPKVQNIPLMTAGPVVYAQRALLAPIVVDPNCQTSTAFVTLPKLLADMKAGALTPIISCVPGSYPADPRVGSLYVLDAQEGLTLTAAIDGYNAYLKGKADALGWAYWDPNPAFVALKGTAASALFPNFASATNPFGTAFSLDGVHPTAEGHKLIANNLIATINAKYGTTLPAVP